MVRVPSASRPSEDRRPGPRRSWRQIPRDFWAKFAIGWSGAQFLILACVEVGLAVKHYQYTQDLINLGVSRGERNNATALTLYHGLVVASQAFQLFLCFDAVVHSSMIQLGSTTAFNTALFGYSIIQYTQANSILSVQNQARASEASIGVHPTATLEMVVIAFSAIFTLGWFVITQRLYRVFGWSVFKELGADIGVKRRLKLYHIYLMLLKLDVFFFMGFDLQFLVLVLIGKDKEAIITHTAIAIPVTIGMLVVAYLAIRRESSILMSITLIAFSGGIGYLISKLVDVITNTTPKYEGSKKSLTFFEVITLALSIATFVVAILNFRNFGKGLKEQLSRSRNPNMELDDFNRGNGKDTRWPLD
ncbi:hypothetical protein HK097_005811 [Rhizophlyctis rosea]|uniref:Uncharacterized protein n=1 Tax=Rhizophlyctis rosea TaxID=64517 RepID=A0AAD5SGF3_9FUNG|nr:hypothetical protein HK097_005811 [Rhizophlyctis rosea]